ncbi:ABC transporter ATP-binding protein [Pseudooceanicola aestuarii]|uniref:ABC transporter ATP-binding protein n=1 Tax=Pseudooceanicola aestuarii TaxID=2697319 RepID=UPI0013D398F2|nr:ABC transporter ATP-binding protein [Pseudooceanicola aestuarii]
MTDTLLEAGALVKDFPLGRGRHLRAVDRVSFKLKRGEILGLVGESGSGKSTLARILARLLPQTEGSVWFDKANLAGLSGSRFARAAARRDIQMVFQDPLASLNPRWRAARIIGDPIRCLGTAEERAEAPALIAAAAERSGLPVALLDRFPHQLSGGQRARVDIARAIVLRPKLLILDEPTSALDASLQAHVIQTLMQLRADLDLTYVFVTHDLNLVHLIADRILVMQKGKLVEEGAVAALFADPKEAYTRELIAAIPQLGQRRVPGP